VAAATASGLANLGGQAQFRIPDGTCELYWLSLDSGERRPNESWESYATRSASEVLTQFAALRERTDFIKQALQWPVLAQLHAAGADLNQYLCFVLYFVTESRYGELVALRRKGGEPV
jgi:hypothetical protein